MYYSNELYHHGILGQKWGVRRYQNEDGTLTEAGKRKSRRSQRNQDSIIVTDRRGDPHVVTRKQMKTASILGGITSGTIGAAYDYSSTHDAKRLVASIIGASIGTAFVTKYNDKKFDKLVEAGKKASDILNPPIITERGPKKTWPVKPEPMPGSNEWWKKERERREKQNI